MSIPATTREDEIADAIARTRGQLLAGLAAASHRLQGAADTLADLRGNTIYDLEFIDGRDLATFIDDSIRLARAGYAVVHTVIDKETP